MRAEAKACVGERVDVSRRQERTAVAMLPQPRKAIFGVEGRGVEEDMRVVTMAVRWERERGRTGVIQAILEERWRGGCWVRLIKRERMGWRLIEGRAYGCALMDHHMSESRPNEPRSQSHFH